MIRKTIAALMLVTSIALAAVSFNFATGQGFVGKGDVQTAFGWTNAQLQHNASGVAFVVDTTQTFAAVCEWTTGSGTRGEQTHEVTLNRHSSINSSVDYDARIHRQIDGFNLLGYGETFITGGTLPVVGSPCVANESGIDFNGTWLSVTLTGSSGGLYVTYADNSVLLLQQ